MPKIRPFRALRPSREHAKKISCLPYDVMSTAEARKMAAGNDESFLHIVRSEIDLAENIDEHSPQVYEKARENLASFRSRSLLLQDERECFYIYEEIMQGRSQCGVVALSSVADYESGVIKRHEFTLPEKETDRINNFLYCRAHTEPVFFVSRTSEVLNSILGRLRQAPPEYDFVSEDNITHRLWVVAEDEDISAIESAFSVMDALYIADGHHRTASSAKVRERLREMGEASEQADYIMAVIFPEEQVRIMDYNRLLVDIAPYTHDSFLSRLAEDFIVKRMGEEIFRTDQKHVFSLYLDKCWYSLTAKPESFPAEDPVESIDAAILQRNVFDKLLGIVDPRTSKRLKFVGGIRGYEELSAQVDSGNAVCAIGVCPVDIEELLRVADSGLVMPPKSTWFEPKLRSGLFIHLL